MVNSSHVFVCGHPISHSRSPLIHSHWLSHYGIAGNYERIDVHPTQLKKFLHQLKEQGWLGGNITIPHKEKAFNFVDHLDEAANKIGAVNTVWFEGRKLWGGNTDAYGFSANLDEQIPAWRNAKTAIIFGAGGASRAIVFALLEAGLKKIQIINRTLERAEHLAALFGKNISAHRWHEAAELLLNTDLIINTTSLGMKGQAEFPVLLDNARSDCLAADIVYVPLETPFLKMAKAKNLATSDGLGMLLHQAVPGFEKWFGIRPSVTAELREIILADLNMVQHL